MSQSWQEQDKQSNTSYAPMSKPKKEKKNLPISNVENYNGEVKLGDKLYKASSPDLTEAFDVIVIEVGDDYITNKGIVTVSKGDLVKERAFPPIPMRRFIRNAINRGLWIKTIERRNG